MSKSVRIHEYGAADVLHIEDVAVDEPAEGEVRLRVRAIGINRTEITLRSGRAPVLPPLPTQIGFEAAGEIESVGPDVTGFAVGDRVALVPAYGASKYGLYGELSLAPARSLVAIPEGQDFVTAAAIWSAYGAAWAGLVAVGGLKAGQTVLISAASSSVGLAAIQIANRLGARPVAVTRTREKAPALVTHGAAAVIATQEDDLVASVRGLTGKAGAELVFDPVGGPGFETLAAATADGGTLILYGALDRAPTTVPPFDIFVRDLRVRGMALTSLTRDDRTLAGLKDFVTGGIADGSLVPTIARTFPFAEIADAHRFVEAGGHVGKVVVTL